MSADELRHRAQQRQTKDRFTASSAVAIGLFLCVVFAVSADRADQAVTRVGWGLMSLSCLYFAYQAYRWIWPGQLAPDATVSASLHFYRGQLEKRRDYGRHIWRRTGIPFCFLGLAIVLVPVLIKSPGLLVNTAPFFVLLAIWVVIFFPARKRNQQQLQQEIEELRRFEGGSKD